jgi:tetratricopeptide (TPR) repeat protein
MENAMKVKMNGLRNLAMVCAIFLSVNGFSQISKDEKTINKCIKIYNEKGKLKGFEKLEAYMNQRSFNSYYAYETLVAMGYGIYEQNKSFFGGITLEVTGEDSLNSDSLGNDLLTSLMDELEENFIDVCRRSTIEGTSSSGDMYLRIMRVDVDVDSAVSEKAKAYYHEGEIFFGKKDFDLAALNYRKAFLEDPNYYKAVLYYGDTFWAKEQYDSALFYFAKARDMEPNQMSARIFMVDALREQGLYYRAKKEAIDALLVYPGYNMKYKLEEILNVENKTFSERRITRTFYANDMGNPDQNMLLSTPIWNDYRAAKLDVSKYCNEDGIIEENGEFTDRYLEVYSYRRMLEKHPNDLPEFLHFADKMREEGYLEPYIFICLFHYDIYAQFKDYMSVEANRIKTVEFIEKYVIEAIPTN